MPARKMLFQCVSLALAVAVAVELGVDLAQAPNTPGRQLSASPPMHMYDDFFDSATTSHVLGVVPKDEASWSPCVGQTSEFASKRCTLLPVAGDEVMEAVVHKLGSAWDVDVASLRQKGLPVIRYLPGAPPVGLHGDMGHDGLIPTTTLLLYLTDADRDADRDPDGGQTLFPDAEPLDKDAAGGPIHITPARGSVLAFQNVESATGAPHPNARHSVGAVPASAKRDRLVVQIPILHHADGAMAYPEHVSGPGKEPGEHEALHGTPQQKAAYAAAIAAGASTAAAFAAALAGKYEGEDEKEKKEE